MKHIFIFFILSFLLKSNEFFKIHAWSKDSKVMYFIKNKKSNKATIYLIKIQDLVTDSILYKESIFSKNDINMDKFISENKSKIRKLRKSHLLFETNEIQKQFFPFNDDNGIYDLYSNKRNLYLLSAKKGQKIIANDIEIFDKLHFYRSPYENRIAVVSSYNNGNEFRIIGANLETGFKGHLYDKIDNFEPVYKSLEYSSDSLNIHVKYNDEMFNRLFYTKRIKLYHDVNLHEKLTLALLSKLGYKKDELWVENPGEIFRSGESERLYRNGSAGNKLNDFQINFQSHEEFPDSKRLKNCLWYIKSITNLTLKRKVYIQNVYKLTGNFDDAAEYELPLKRNKSSELNLSLKHDIHKICFEVSGKIDMTLLDKNLITLSDNRIILQNISVDLKIRHLYYNFKKSPPKYYLVLDLSKLKNINSYMNRKLRVKIKTKSDNEDIFTFRSFIPKNLDNIFKQNHKGDIYFDIKIVE